MNLMKTSLLAVFVKDTSEIFNLAVMLERSLPKMAGLSLIIFSLKIDPQKLQQRIGIFAKLINERKITKLHNCPIDIPQSELFETVRRRRLLLNTINFGAYLEFYISKELKAALETSSLIWKEEQFKFKKVELKELVQDTFTSFLALINYAA